MKTGELWEIKDNSKTAFVHSDWLIIIKSIQDELVNYNWVYPDLTDASSQLACMRKTFLEYFIKKCDHWRNYESR